MSQPSTEAAYRLRSTPEKTYNAMIATCGKLTRKPKLVYYAALVIVIVVMVLVNILFKDHWLAAVSILCLLAALFVNILFLKKSLKKVCSQFLFSDECQFKFDQDSLYIEAKDHGFRYNWNIVTDLKVDGNTLILVINHLYVEAFCAQDSAEQDRIFSEILEFWQQKREMR